MSRVDWKPGTLIYPLPAILVSCGDIEGEMNLFTASWVGTVCTNPPMCYVSIRPERHSYELIKSSGEFALNLTNKAIVKETDWCGVVSGRKEDKFVKTGLTPEAGKFISAPLVAESPISIECKLHDIIPLGSHDMFIANVVNIRADEQYIDSQTGAFDMERAGLIAYAHGEYFALGEYLGHFGYSVRKPRKPHRRGIARNPRE